MGKRIFISGPISSDPNFMKRFEKAAKVISKLGYTPVNPTGLSIIYSNVDPDNRRFWLQESMKLLMTCDAVTFLPGSNKSRGCLLEAHVVEELNIPIMDFDLL